MKEIKAYQSANGKVFETPETCKSYENDEKAKGNIKIWANTYLYSMNSGHKEKVIEAMFKHRAELLEALK